MNSDVLIANAMRHAFEGNREKDKISGRQVGTREFDKRYWSTKNIYKSFQFIY